jgi:heme-degrading monooxygenase HmoA
MTKLKVTDTIKAAGLNAFAEAAEAPRTTVAYWRDEDKVPAWRTSSFVKAAKKLGIDPCKPPKAEARV